MKTFNREDFSNANVKQAEQRYLKYAPIIEHIERCMLSDDSLSVRSIVTQLGLDSDYNNIYRAVKKYSDIDVSIKNNGKGKKSKIAFEQKRVIDDNLVEDVRKWYCTERLSLKQVGERLGTTAATVMSFMERHNIPRRTKSEIATENNNKPGRREYLRETSTRSYLNRRTSNTKPERDFKQWLEENNIKYIEQYRRVGNAHPYDFFLPEYNLIVEIDGHYWHSKPDQIVKDQQHVDDAISRGYNIVRICTKQLQELNGDYSKWITVK